MLVNGHELNFIQNGSENGPNILLLHHGLGSIKAWRRQIPVLAEAGFRVTAYDRWGYGGSDGRTALDLPTFATDIDDLHSLLQQLGITTASLLGHSDGGTIALYFSAQYPRQVTSLVTVAAHIYIEPEMETGCLDIKNTYQADERFRRSLFDAHGDKYESVFHNWYEGWYRQDFIGWDMRQVLGRINCPSLIVQGEDDEYATPRHAKDIAGAIPGAEAWIIPGAGHMLPLENAELFNAGILRFLEKQTVSL